MEYVTVYGQDGRMLAVLENADRVGYTLQHNDLWTAVFSLPTEDPKNAYCQAHNFVRLPDGPRETGLYRIVGMPSSDETGMGGVKTYSLEHVMATLLDDVLFGYRELGGTGVYTADVIDAILGAQTVRRWQRGACDFTDQYQYHFENVSLLSALLSLGEVLVDEYTWEFDVTTTPWTVSLRRADSVPGCGIHYGRNLVGITKSMDASALVTRLYPLGYGEGVNQLTIREVNSGLPYIEANTASVWGVKSSVWTDTRIQDAWTLLARARAVLDGYKNPYISYTAKAVDLYRETGQSWDDYMPGKLVRVMDGEHGIDFDARIVTISKPDINGDPGSIEITIANAERDAAGAINTLADRVGIGELYSQGATNLFAVPFADNADTAHPAKFRVYIPEGMVRINKMLLSWQIASFRAYSTGAAAGGGSTRTSDSGGGSTQTSSTNDTVTYTSEYGGDCQVLSEQKIINASGTYDFGWVGDPIDDDGYQKNSTDANVLGTETSQAPDHAHTFGHVHDVDGHSHVVDSHAHTLDGVSSMTGMTAPYTDTVAGRTGGAKVAGSPVSYTGDAGGHVHSVQMHTHGMKHWHKMVSFTIPPLNIEIPAHGHNVRITGHNHTVTIPSHTHTLTLPEHEHGIVYGIYEGGRASSVSIVVDGTTVPASELSRREIDVTAWLSVDSNGRIRRGAWHEIQIVPDGLTRIEANLTAQVFVQSVGGGDH